MATKTANQKKGGSSETGLRELFINELKDIYWAEKHLVKALPKMKKAATKKSLKTCL